MNHVRQAVNLDAFRLPKAFLERIGIAFTILTPVPPFPPYDGSQKSRRYWKKARDAR